MNAEDYEFIKILSQDFFINVKIALASKSVVLNKILAE